MMPTRTSATPQENLPVNDVIPPKTKNPTKATARTKKSSNVSNTTGGKAEQLTVTAVLQAGKPTTASGGLKRQREVDSTSNNEVQPLLATDTLPKKPRMAEKAAKSTALTRRSSHVQTAAPAPAPQKRKRRTKAEIAADKAKMEAKAREADELTRERHRTMVQMDINEDKDREATAVNTIRTLADLDKDESGEEFVGYNEVSDSDDSDEGIKVAVKVKQNGKATSKESIGGGKKQKTGGNNKKVTFASGLRQDWESGRLTSQTQSPHVQISAGGLESDVEDVNPYQTVNKSNDEDGVTDMEVVREAKRDSSRQNEMVSEVLLDSGEFVPHATRKTKAAVRPVNGTTICRDKPGHQNCGLDIPTTVATKPKPKIKHLTGNNVRISDLPDFMGIRWRSAFLPTLYSKFFSSTEPFDDFTASSNEFVALLRSVMTEVYPDIDYKVTDSDSIHWLSYNRINAKRSSIGSSALKLIEIHLKTLEEDGHKNWLRWALRGDGPLFFKTPLPMVSLSGQNNNPTYQLPEGRLLSSFIIDLAAPLLKLKAGSVSKNGHPKGLVAVILGALERAVRYHSRPSISAPEFSKEHYGAKVKSYYDSFHGVPNDRWEELVKICGAAVEENEEDVLKADLSMLDQDRPFIFDFCSPAKSCN